MKNNYFDQIIDMQNQWLNFFSESSKNFMNNSGKNLFQNNDVFSYWTEKQKEFVQTFQKIWEQFFNGVNQNNTSKEFLNANQELFKNMMHQQLEFFKNWLELQSRFFNAFGISSRHEEIYKGAEEFNNTWTNIYNSFINSLNNSYDILTKNFQSSFQKDILNNFLQGNKIFTAVMEFYKPCFDAFQNGKVNFDELKKYYNPQAYNELSKKIFGDFFAGLDVKRFYEESIKTMHGFFVNQNHLAKEFFKQMENIREELPKIFHVDLSQWKEIYTNHNQLFTRSFEPLLKLVNPGKEKENMESLLELMDRVADYTLKQGLMQSLIQKSVQLGMEETFKHVQEFFSNPENIGKSINAQDFYNQWVKTNEKIFHDLFSSEEFSKLKGETLNLSMDIKLAFDKFISNLYGAFPFVFKNDLNEIYQELHDLKKRVKELEHNGGTFVEHVEDKTNKKSSKK
ncbi:MAG: hypothetical protein N3F09_06650 [Bacteroidia bacterium]|nr:hypothetical protein [Bacteroidia bacterium]